MATRCLGAQRGGEYRLNPLTVLRATAAGDEQLVEKRRAAGCSSATAPRALMKGERQRFLEDEWPRIAATIQRLGFDMSELMEAARNAPPRKPTTLHRCGQGRGRGEPA